MIENAEGLQPELVAVKDKHPEKVALFGGVAGAQLGVKDFQICEGLICRQTYAHLMSPYILAFRRPESAGRHHPGPWKATNGGMWMDVDAEIVLLENARPTGFDRLNTLWWILALLRLSSGARLRMPVVSDTSFSSIAESPNDPTMWPIETLPRQLKIVSRPPQVIEKRHLLWVRDVFRNSSALMNDTEFRRAFQTFDAVIWAHSTGSAMIMIWAALETLVRPGRKNITKNLAKTLAALLQAPGGERERLFQRIVSLYEARGGSAHASRSAQANHLTDSFHVARQAFIACIDNRELPKAERLHEMWRLKQ